MIVVWRGWGILAFVAAFLPLASCIGLIEWNFGVALFMAGITALIGGILCRYLGRKGNEGGIRHSLYNIPVETWGLVYMIGGGLLALMSGLILLKQRIAG